MKNTKFKVGDKVHIKSREWFEKNIKNTQDNGYYISGTNVFFNNDMFEYCGKSFKIVNVLFWFGEKIYILNTDKIDWRWSEKMMLSAKELRKQKLQKLKNANV
jgi:hypothetical protein